MFTTFRNRRLTFLGSGVSIGLLYGAVDGLTWSYPFESLWRNAAANFYLYYGENRVGLWLRYYPSTVLRYWTGLSAPMSLLCLIGAFRLPQLFVTAAVIAMTFSLVGHKEFRFIYPAILLVVIVSGIGLAQVISWITKALQKEGLDRRSAIFAPSAIALAVIVLTQLALANGSEPYRELWTRGRDMILASRYIARMGAVCGIGVLDYNWANTGGYAYLHHAVPLYWADRIGRPDPNSVAFNTVIFDRGKPLGTGYVEKACFGDTCVAQREGTCSPAPMKDMGSLLPLDPWQPEVGR